MSSAGATFRLGEKIGTGAFSYVFRSEETSTGHVVALKKSRASLKVQRTMVYHEARIMRLLAGHPSIPAVFAYGHLEHFEYMAMELLGRSLSDLSEEHRNLPLQLVLQLADQMLSALEHIHSLRIVHRDIKPSNIMTQINTTSKFCLIDFGLARPCVLGEPNTHNLFEERKNLVGTPTWASLNAHHGIDLAPRDDLESLAYVLLSVLRGGLPWDKNCKHGTILGRLAHIREKKRGWPGSRLAEGHLAVFGELVDYARGLSFNEPIEYGKLRAQFESLQSGVAAAIEPNSTGHIICSPTSVTPKSCGESLCPVEVGQLVFIQILAKTSIEGHSMRANDPSYWHNTALSSDEWRTTVRPAIVIDITFEKWSSLHSILVVSLAHGVPENEESVVPLPGSPHIMSVVEGNETESRPLWPFPDAYCYAFPRATRFHCLPDQPRVLAHWKVDPDTTQRLRDKFGKKHSINGSTEQDPDPDIRYDTRMSFFAIKFFVALRELGRPGDDLSWAADHGMGRTWFDERVKIARRRAWDDGPEWTGIPDADGEPAPDSSYYESDYSLWEFQQGERDRSLTLLPDQREIYEQACAKGELMNIVQVI